MNYADAIVYLKENNITKDDGTFYEFGEVKTATVNKGGEGGREGSCSVNERKGGRRDGGRREEGRREGGRRNGREEEVFTTMLTILGYP